MATVPDTAEGLRKRADQLRHLADHIRTHGANPDIMGQLATLIHPAWAGRLDLLADVWRGAVEFETAFLPYWLLTRPPGARPCLACLADPARDVATLRPAAEGTDTCTFHLGGLTGRHVPAGPAGGQVTIELTAVIAS